MSVQWAAVAGFLYFEIALSLLLILPILKPATWKRLFGWSVISSLKTFWKTAFYAVLLILVVLFLDSIRAMTKYGKELENQTLDSQLDQRFKECRGQRNFYITGFSLFLMFVIYRLVSLLSEQAKLEANHTAALKQAKNVSRELQQRLDQADKSAKSSSEAEGLRQELKEAIADRNALEKQVQSANADRDAMKRQSESLQREYDRVSEELQTLQKKQDASSKED